VGNRQKPFDHGERQSVVPFGVRGLGASLRACTPGAPRPVSGSSCLRARRQPYGLTSSYGLVDLPDKFRRLHDNKQLFCQEHGLPRCEGDWERTPFPFKDILASVMRERAAHKMLVIGLERRDGADRGPEKRALGRKESRKRSVLPREMSAITIAA
jgi:hypothetical protein